VEFGKFLVELEVVGVFSSVSVSPESWRKGNNSSANINSVHMYEEKERNIFAGEDK